MKLAHERLTEAEQAAVLRGEWPAWLSQDLVYEYVRLPPSCLGRDAEQGRRRFHHRLREHAQGVVARAADEVARAVNVDEAMKQGARQVETPEYYEDFAAFLQETRDGTDNDDLSQCCDFIVVEILKDDGWLAIVKEPGENVAGTPLHQ